MRFVLHNKDSVARDNGDEAGYRISRNVLQPESEDKKKFIPRLNEYFASCAA